MFRILKLLLLALWLLLILAVGWPVCRLKKHALRDRIYRVCMVGVAYIIGLKCKLEGELSHARPLLVVSNHLSYLDVVVLGSVFPFRFTPKSEIKSWPFIGLLTTLTGAIYIERKPSKLGEATSAIGQALSSGEVVCVFPEATTGNGLRLLPFKSSIFSLAETTSASQPLSVQPVALCYSRVRGLPLDSSQWPSIAWYGDMDLVPHLWGLLGLGSIHVSVIALPVVQAAGEGGRKELAAACEQAIRDALEAKRHEKPPVASPRPPLHWRQVIQWLKQRKWRK